MEALERIKPPWNWVINWKIKIESRKNSRKVKYFYNERDGKNNVLKYINQVHKTKLLTF